MGASKNKDILKKVLDFAMSVSYIFINLLYKYDKICLYVYTFCRMKCVHKIQFL